MSYTTTRNEVTPVDEFFPDPIAKGIPPCPQWDLLSTVLPHLHRGLLFGPPGTGKTSIGLREGVPPGGCFAVTLTEDTPVAELRGHFIRGSDGEFTWLHGPAIKAWLQGARLVVNEIDHASPEVQSFLHVILDDPETAFLTLPNGVTVRPQKGFSALATMNGDPQYLPEALADRFPIKFEINRTNPEAFEVLPERYRFAAYTFADTVQELERISIRKWIEVTRLEDSGLPADLALRAVFGPQADEIHKALTLQANQSSEDREI